jgi:Spy/CpxP family protein refolding chaperone
VDWFDEHIQFGFVCIPDVAYAPNELSFQENFPMFNRNCKTIVGVVIGIIALNAPAFAQTGAPTTNQPPATNSTAPVETKQAAHAKLLSELNLTQDQKDKIKAIQEAQKAKLLPIRKNKSLTLEQKKEQMKPIVKDTMKQIAAILTPEQKAKLKELRKEQKAEKAAANAPKTSP